MVLWSLYIRPVILSIMGYKNIEDVFWLELEDGRLEFFKQPVWSKIKEVQYVQIREALSYLFKKKINSS